MLLPLTGLMLHADFFRQHLHTARAGPQHKHEVSPAILAFEPLRNDGVLFDVGYQFF